jgi:hypothetical protein
VKQSLYTQNYLKHWGDNVDNDNNDFTLWSIVVDGIFNLLFLIGVFAVGMFLVIYFWSNT